MGLNVMGERKLREISPLERTVHGLGGMGVGALRFS